MEFYIKNPELYPQWFWALFTHRMLWQWKRWKPAGTSCGVNILCLQHMTNSILTVVQTCMQIQFKLLGRETFLFWSESDHYYVYSLKFNLIIIYVHLFSVFLFHLSENDFVIFIKIMRILNDVLISCMQVILATLTASYNRYIIIIIIITFENALLVHFLYTICAMDLLN